MPDSQPDTAPAEPILLERTPQGAVLVTLNRPHRRNSIDRALVTALLSAVVEAADDPTTRVIAVTGAGSAFCAGDDIHAVVEGGRGRPDGVPADPVTHDYLYLRLCEAIVQAPKPVVVGLNGVAVGAGTEIACSADYRLASDRARIGSGLVHVGHLGNAVMLPRVVGPARATEIYLTGRLVEADEALRIGLVDRVVPAADFDTELRSLVAALAQAPTRTIGLFKELRERAWGVPIEHGLSMQNAYHRRTSAEVADSTEGLVAFAEHRRPRFTGR